MPLILKQRTAYVGIVLAVLALGVFFILDSKVSAPGFQDDSAGLQPPPVVSLGIPVAKAWDGSYKIVTQDVAVTRYQDNDMEGVFEVETYVDEAGEYAFRFHPKPTAKPGRYIVSGVVETPDGLRDFSQDFWWGVLSMNFNKSMYVVGEEGYIQMAVLDDVGDTICNAPLRLKIVRPDGDEIIQSTDSGVVVQNDACGPNNVIDEPDYYSYLTFDQVGVYQFELTAYTENGERTIQDFIEVKEGVPFSVERVGPTRIWPLADYDMTIRITANQDFEGMVKEYVPDSFVVVSENKDLVWDVALRAGETVELVYTFDAPDISPEFYLLGPLQLRTQDAGNKDTNDGMVFEEARRWQIAGDAAAYVQSDSQSQSSSTTNVLAFPSNNTAGNLIIVAGVINSQSQTMSVSDSQGNTYTSAIGPIDSLNSGRGQIWYAENISAGANTVTLTITGSVNSQIYIHEYSGLATSSSLDKTDSSTGTSSTCDSTAQTISQANELLFGLCFTDANTGSIDPASGSSYTEREEINTRTQTQDRVVSSVASYDSQWDLGGSADWTGLLATFKEPATNNAPTITSVTDTPDPVDIGQEIDFSVDWNDADAGDVIKAKVCKTDSLTNMVCDGGHWATSTAFITTDPEVVSYTALEADVGSNNYYAFVCDDDEDCSASTSGTFSVDDITLDSLTDTPDPTNPNRSVTWVVDWSSGTGTAKGKACKTDSLTNQVCDGGHWASSTAFTTKDPFSISYDVVGGDAGQTRNYYFFVCDGSGTCTSSSSGTFSVNGSSDVNNIEVRGGAVIR